MGTDSDAGMRGKLPLRLSSLSRPAPADSSNRLVIGLSSAFRIDRQNLAPERCLETGDVHHFLTDHAPEAYEVY